MWKKPVSGDKGVRAMWTYSSFALPTWMSEWRMSLGSLSVKEPMTLLLGIWGMDLRMES